MATIILDVTKKPPVRVTGKLIKRYQHGLTIDDERGVRYYATFDRVICEERGKDAGEGLLW